MKATALLAALLLLSLVGRACADWSVDLPGLVGDYIGSSTAVRVSIVLPESVSVVTGMTIHWSGSLTPGLVVHDGQDYAVSGELDAWVDDPNAPFAVAVALLEGGAFNCESPFYSPHGYGYLDDHSLQLLVILSNMIPEFYDSFQLVRRASGHLDSARLTIKTRVVPVECFTWGAIRLMYR
jgi:hypothetical protein